MQLKEISQLKWGDMNPPTPNTERLEFSLGHTYQGGRGSGRRLHQRGGHDILTKSLSLTNLIFFIPRPKTLSVLSFIDDHSISC